jgi:hypothetical protein
MGNPPVSLERDNGFLLRSSLTQHIVLPELAQNNLACWRSRYVSCVWAWNGVAGKEDGNGCLVPIQTVPQSPPAHLVTSVVANLLPAHLLWRFPDQAFVCRFWHKTLSAVLSGIDATTFFKWRSTARASRPIRPLPHHRSARRRGPRVRAALKNCGYDIPPHITINLAPADVS